MKKILLIAIAAISLGLAYSCKTEEEAQAVLANAYKKWNSKKVYNADGKRSELVDSINGIGVSLVSDKDMDHRMEIIAHKIRKRIVTEWETVEES